MIRRAAEAGAVHPALFGGGVGLLCTCLCCLFAWRYASVPYLLHDSGWLYLQKRPSCCTYAIALSRSSVVRTTEAGADRGRVLGAVPQEGKHERRTPKPYQYGKRPPAIDADTGQVQLVCRKADRSRPLLELFLLL